MARDTGTGRSKAFTLLELMLVLTIMTTLVAIAIPIYRGVVIRSNETTLKANLHTIRDVIDQYTADKKKAPQSLQDLIDAGYFRKELPLDPMTKSHDWQEEYGTDLTSPDQTETGIVDVHSLSPEISTDGTPYNTW